MRLVDEALDSWRAGERLLDRVPADDPDHDAVRFAVATLKTVYGHLTADDADDEITDDAIRRTIAAMRDLIGHIAARHEPDPK